MGTALLVGSSISSNQSAHFGIASAVADGLVDLGAPAVTRRFEAVTQETTDDVTATAASESKSETESLDDSEGMQ